MCAEPSQSAYSGFEFCHSCVIFLETWFGKMVFTDLQNGKHFEDVLYEYKNLIITQKPDPCSWEPPSEINVGKMLQEKCKTSKYIFVHIAVKT